MKLKSLSLIVAALVVCLVVAGCGTTTTTNANKNTNKVTTNANKTTTNTNSITNTNTVAATTTLTTDKTSYAPGANIIVTYKIVEPLKDGAWIGIVPSATKHGLETDGDNADIDYEYLDNSTSGTFTFTAPTTAGSYDFRVYDTEFEGGVEIGTVTFTVTQ